jgi:hypothetical protein
VATIVRQMVRLIAMALFLGFIPSRVEPLAADRTRAADKCHAQLVIRVLCCAEITLRGRPQGYYSATTAKRECSRKYCAPQATCT